MELSGAFSTEAVAKAARDMAARNKRATRACRELMLDFSSFSFQHALERRAISDADAVVIAHFLGTSSQCTRLSLAGNSVGDAGAVRLAMALVRVGGMEWLNLAQNSVACTGAAALAAALATHSSLEHLSLQQNRVGVRGGRALGAALAHNGRLRALALDHNTSLADEGTTFLAMGLQANTGLNRLTLTGVGMTATGARALARSLCANSTLQHLDLSYNAIGDAGALDLATAISSGVHLRSLRLGSCSITHRGAAALEGATRLRPGCIVSGVDIRVVHTGGAGGLPMENGLLGEATLPPLEACWEWEPEGTANHSASAGAAGAKLESTALPTRPA